MQPIQYLETLKTPPTDSKDVRRSKSQPYPKKGSIFATTVTVTDQKKDKEKESLPTVKSCLFCEGGHALEKRRHKVRKSLS